MVAGRQWPHGDPFLQRQNEPSVAVSTRNPLHLLAGANDYRTVDIPFDTGAPVDDEERGDAWVGVFKSRNGGQTWWSDLLPGYPQDATSTSPIHGFQAAADPVVRAGANGMFYYSGIALNRGTNPLGAVFVSRFIDNNNTENGDPIAYIGTSVIDKGTSGAFIDKPWIAVAPGTGQCTVNGQTFAAQNVYLAYTTFVGNDNNIRTKLMFTRSTDCGATWGTPTKLSESYAVNQGASIAVAPNGTVYVVWRRFKTVTDTNAIMIAKSTDKGQTFTKGAVVRDINPFEQGMTYYSIRTNAYPAAAVDDSNNLYVVWSDRGNALDGDGRILMMRSADGSSWTGPTLVDGTGVRGHQFMPTVAVAGGKVVVAYYDLRDDSTIGVFTPNVPKTGDYTESRQQVGLRLTDPTQVFLKYLVDQAHQRRHTLDLRAAQASTSVMPTAFTEFTRVSRYAFGSRPLASLPPTLCASGPGCIEQLQYNPPNLPMFRLGTAPFIGDYIDLTGYSSGTERVFHAVWTDNRDVRPPADGNWANYTPPHLGTQASNFTNGNVPDCVVGQTGMRNQNIYSARITNGLFVSSPGNAKQLVDKNGQPVTRAFVIYVQNATTDKPGKTFHLTVQQPTPGWASFTQFQPYQQQTYVTVPPRSSIARTVYVNSSYPHATVNVSVVESSNNVDVPNGLSANVIINPDVSNPDVSNPDVSNPDVSNPDVSNPDVSNPDVSNVEVHNPDVSNPSVLTPDVSNPDVSNPDVSNPDVSNPDVSNPDVSNPDVSNPDVSNPDVSNPDVSNPDVSNASVTDTTWTTHNKGNTTSGYSVKLATSTPVPQGVRTQLIINRIYQTPVARDCRLGVENKRQILANILDPQFTTFGQLTTTNPDDATLWLAPGDAARITLRVYNPTPLLTPFNPATAIAPVVIAEAVNSDDAANGITTPPIALPLIITTTSVNDAIAGQPYNTPMAATGGTGTYTWNVTGPGVFTVSNGVLSGTFANVGDTPITVAVSDSAVPAHVTQKQFTVHVLAPLSISTASLPSGVRNQPYNASLAATGGKAPYTFDIVSGSLPSALGLTAGGVLGGTPVSVANNQLTFRVTDAANRVATKALTVVIADPLVNTTTLPDAITNQAYSTTLTASGGIGPYTWSLPFAQPGVSVTPNGLLTTAAWPLAGPQSIVVRVTDAANPPQVLTGGLPLRVVDPLTITTTSLPNATQGFAYSTTLQSTGGTAPIHWSAVSSVPDDMTLSDAGTISGISPYTETPVVTVRATDSSNPPQVVTSQAMPLVVQSAVCTGNAFALFDNWNGGAVGDNGQSPAFSTKGSTYCLDHIEDYHWNSGNGAAPGTIGLFFTDRNRTLGPWTATATSGQNNAPNVNWSAATAPAVFVLNGSYSVIDSSPSTWSQNAQSSGLGFSRVWVRTAVPPTHTATLHLQYNGAPLVLTVAPEKFGYSDTANAYLNDNQIVWNGNDTITVSGLPNGTYNIEVATREHSPQEYLPGEFWNQVRFTINNADMDVTYPEHKLLHITSPADNATTFSAFACPPALSIPAPTLLSWDPIGVPAATYQYFVYRGSCAANTSWVLLSSGTTSATSASLSLPTSAAGEFYAIEIQAYNANNQEIGQVMTIGTNWHGWALEFTVP